MVDRILVLTNSRDGEHSDLVIQNLKSRSERVFRLDVDRLAKGEATITFINDSSCTPHFILENSDDVCDSKSIKSVWYRRPNRFDLSVKDVVQRDFAEGEIRATLEGIYLTIPKNVFWMNHPFSLESARKKIRQMEIAYEIGFSMPRTIVTNSPEHAKRFINENASRKTIFKPIHSNFFDYGEKGLIVPTTVLTETHISNLDLIRSTPSIFQEFVEKIYDIRLTMVGDQLFTVAIDSQEFQDTAVDWRNPSFFDKLRHRIIEPPVEMAQKCRRMMKLFNLSFAAFDFVVSREKGNPWYFLEINPNGQWYWIESLTGVCISGAIADMLSKGINQERR